MKTIIYKKASVEIHGTKSRTLPLIFLGILMLVSSPAVSQFQQPNWKSSSHSTAKRVQLIYTAEIGVREKQLNSGPAVEKYLSYVNLPKGNPWCAAFVCWVYGLAGVENPRTGWSPDLFKSSKVIWNRAESRKLKVESKEKHQDGYSLGSMPIRQTTKNQHPTTGDIFGLYFPEKNRIAHVGFIDEWDGTWVITVEGNTNVSGSREGDGVYRKRRPVRSIYKVARYIH